MPFGKVWLTKRLRRIMNSILRKISSYNAIGWRRMPSPRSIPVKNVVSDPYVNSFTPERKHPIRPIKMPAISGGVKRSPDELVSPMLFLATSTPMSPPKSPPIIVLTLKSVSQWVDEILTGFSSHPITREPMNAPIAAPSMIGILLVDATGS